MSVTETDTTTTIASTTTTTVDVIATQCAQSQLVSGAGVAGPGADASLQGTSDPATDACCTSCFQSTGCGIWFYFVGAGCFHGVGETGPDPSAKCPLGLGTWELTGAGAGAGDVGGSGPCLGDLVS